MCASALQDASTDAAVRLLHHRLLNNEAEAYIQWKLVVAGTDPLWNGVTPEFRGIVLGFLQHFDVCVKRVVVDGDAESHFRFCGGSLGNFFFSGARMFCGSLQSAVTLWKLISNMPTLTEVCKNKSLQCARLFSSTVREIFISIWCLSARLRRRV
jgi:hypothetical protein